MQELFTWHEHGRIMERSDAVVTVLQTNSALDRATSDVQDSDVQRRY